MIEYELNYNYIGISKDKMYVTYPSYEEVLGCQISAGSFCEINSAIFTSHKSQSCEYLLFKQSTAKIKQFCKISTLDFLQDNAMALTQNMWVVITTKQ